jgi:hypothetical protein
MRANASGWLTLNLLLAVVLVAISGVMRGRHTGPNFDKVWAELNNPQQSDAPPPPANWTQPAAGGTGTLPVAPATKSAADLPEFNFETPAPK